MTALWSGLLILLAQVAPLSPQASAGSPPVVTMTVRPCTETVSKGQWLLLACTFTVPEGWHIYWKNPGASGVPTTIEVKAPSGFKVKPTVYPRPMEITDSTGMTYGYKKEVTLLQPILPPTTEPADGEQLAFEVTGYWLVCREKCFIGTAGKTIHVPWSQTPRPPEPWAKTLLDLPNWPRPLNLRPQTTAEVRGGHLVIEGPATKASLTGFLPDPTPGVEMGTPRIWTEEGRLFVEVPLTVHPADTLGEPPLARGLLTFGDEATMSAYEVSVPIESGPTESEPPREQREQQP